MRIALASALALATACLGSYSPAPTSPPSGDPNSPPPNGSPDNPPSGSPTSGPTYHADVQPILAKHCLDCHSQAGGANPALDTAAAAQAAASQMSAAVQSGQMPPYPPSLACNQYVGERHITTGEVQTIALWAQAGGPAGAGPDQPYTPPPSVALGAPSTHLQAGPFTPTYPGSAGPNDLYWCFVLSPGIASASDLTAMRVVPGDKSEVHHVIVFRDPGGQGSAGQPASGYECNGAPGEMLTGWVPGSAPLVLPSGVGMTIDPSDRLLMQVHYHYDASVPVAPDSTGVDLWFAAQTMAQHAYVVWTGTPLFTIPANAKGYQVQSTCTVNADWTVLGVAPHMHQHATAFHSTISAANASQCLIDIPRWDFAWQGGYFLQQQVGLHAGDTIATTCTYDNPSASAIKFGEATSDEMCFGFVYVVAAQKPTFNGVVNLFGGANAASICAN